MNRTLIAFVAVLVILGMGALMLRGCETFGTDPATRLHFQIESEVASMRNSGETKRIIEHRPIGDIEGDYRIELRAPSATERGGLFVAKSYDGPLWYHTTAHLKVVEVPKTLVVAHRRGEPTLVTIEIHDGKAIVTDMR